MKLSKPISCILLVDDDPDDNFLHRLVIEDSGHCERVQVAETGHQALAYLTDQTAPNYCRPNVILLDISLERLRYLSDVMPANVQLVFSNRHNVLEQIARADIHTRGQGRRG